MTTFWIALILVAAEGAASTDDNDPPPPPPPPVLATVDDLAAEVARLRALLEAFGVATEAPPPAAEREAIETLQRAGYDVRPMSEAERLAIARERQDERQAAERAREDEELAARVAGAIEDLRAAGYVVNERARPVPPAEAEPPEQIAAEPPEYTPGQQELLAITINRNPRLTAHPALMDSAQRLAEYHASSGRWGHSSRSWRGGDRSENIAWNTTNPTAAGLAHQWITSRKGHRQNWDGSWTYTGVGYARSQSGRLYGVQHFSNSTSPSWAQGTPVLAGSTRYVTRRRWFGRGRRWRLRR